MPIAHPLPRKYMGMLDEIQKELRCMALRARTALSEVEAEEMPYELTRIILRDIESISYRIALDLSQLELSGSCDGCPSAPPTTRAQALLYVIADELERQALLARNHAEEGESREARQNGSELARALALYKGERDEQ